MSTREPGCAVGAGAGISMVRGPAENFVLSGFRAQVAAVADCPSLPDTTLPLISAKAVAIELAAFMAVLKQCAACPLSAFRPDDLRLNRDELLVLALVAALQHGDDEAAVLAASTLTCAARVCETLQSAAGLAMLLKASGALLLPVSAPTLRALTDPEHSETRGASARVTPLTKRTSP